MGIRKRTQLLAPTAGVIVAVCTLFLVLWADLALPAVLGLTLISGVIAYLMTRRFTSARTTQATDGATVSEVFQQQVYPATRTKNA